MKYCIYSLLFVLLIGCSNSANKETAKNEDLGDGAAPVVETTISPETRDNIKGKLKDYIIAQNVLEADRDNIILKSVEIDDECSKFSMVYLWKHSLTKWDNTSDNDVEIEVKDTTIFNIDIYLTNVSDDEISADLNITKKYTEININYYGITYDITNETEYSEQVTLSLNNDVEIKANKTSQLYMLARGRKIKRSELLGFSLDELGYLRNEFYARKGYKFKTEKMQNYFSQMDWYSGTEDNVDNLLSEVELDNVFYIKAMEAELKLKASKSEREILSDLYADGTKYDLKKEDLEALNAHQLSYLRNEFYARKGYKFKSTRLSEYFSATDWYEAKYDNVDDMLSETVKDNIKLIKEVEMSKR